MMVLLLVLMLVLALLTLFIAAVPKMCRFYHRCRLRRR
jgi:hypothetical protein